MGWPATNPAKKRSPSVNMTWRPLPVFDRYVQRAAIGLVVAADEFS